MINLSQQLEARYLEQLGLNPSLEFGYGIKQSLPAAGGSLPGAAVAESIPGVRVWYKNSLSQQLEVRYLEQLGLNPSLEFRYGI